MSLSKHEIDPLPPFLVIGAVAPVALFGMIVIVTSLAFPPTHGDFVGSIVMVWTFLILGVATLIGNGLIVNDLRKRRRSPPALGKLLGYWVILTILQLTLAIGTLVVAGAVTGDFQERANQQDHISVPMEGRTSG